VTPEETARWVLNEWPARLGAGDLIEITGTRFGELLQMVLCVLQRCPEAARQEARSWHAATRLLDEYAATCRIVYSRPEDLHRPVVRVGDRRYWEAVARGLLELERDSRHAEPATERDFDAAHLAQSHTRRTAP
jgi:hypothetical protein